MKIYYLSETSKRHKILDLDDQRFLITPMGVFEIQHTTIIDNPGVDSRLTHMIRSHTEADNPDLEKFGHMVIDVKDSIFLFWYSDQSMIREFGSQYAYEDVKNE